MSLFGVHLTLLIGPIVPVPAPPVLLAAIDRVEVTQNAEEPSGFQIVFRAGRSEPDIIDYPLLDSPLLVPGSRVIIMITVDVVPTVLFDGFITHQQLAPAQSPGATILTVTGEDVTFAMDREERSAEHVGQPENVIAQKILASYAPLLLQPPVVIPPPIIDIPLPIDRVPVQVATDFAYLKQLAARFDYVFAVTPGPVPNFNQAYWGPQRRLGVPRPALSVGMGPETNVRQLDIQYDAGAVTSVGGVVQDRLSNTAFPVQSLPVSLFRPPLSTRPALADPTVAATTVYRAQGGRSVLQALAEAQAQQDSSTDVVVLEGELDTVRYPGVLQPPGLVGVRGVGLRYNGLYYVKRVTHTLVPNGVTRESSFTTKFSLRREGLDATVPVVIP